MNSGLTKNQTLRRIYTDLLEKEDTRLWQYFAGVLIKHALKVGNKQERKQFSQWVKTDSQKEIGKFIESKLPKIIKPVSEEVVALRKKIHSKVKAIK